MNENRRIATTVGVLFIIGTVAGILSGVVTGGFSMDAPAYVDKAAADPGQIQLGALFILVMGLALAMVPVVIYPILRRQSQTLAIGYVVFRGALETSTYIAMTVCWLLLVEVAGGHDVVSGAAAASQSGLGILLVDAQDQIATMTSLVFGIGALMLYYLLYRGRLIPRWISGWGIIAAVLTLVGAVVDIFGAPQDVWALPMLPQEMVMAVWLIVKGFDARAVAAGGDRLEPISAP